MRNLTPYLLILFLLAGGFLFLWPSEDSAGEEAEQTAQTQEAATVVGGPDGPEAGKLEEVAVERDSAETSEEPTILAAPNIEGRGLDLLVVEYSTDLPVANAVVWVSAARTRYSAGRDLLQFLRTEGEAYRVDGEGKLRIPASWGGRLLAGQADGLWGSMNLTLPEFGDTAILRLAPARALQVSVVNHEGKGLENVAVGLFGSPYGNISLLRKAYTDEAGVAWIPQANDPALRMRGTANFWVDTVTPKLIPPSMTYPLAEMPQRSLLQLESPAGLAVQLQGLEGKPLLAKRTVTLVRAMEDGSPAGRANPSIRAGSASDPSTGKVRFDGLEPGVPLVMQVAFLEGGKTEDQYLEALQPGEQREIVVRQGVGVPEMRLRLVDNMGKPFAVKEMACSLYQPLPNYPNFPKKSAQTTDADGVMHFPLADGSLERDGFELEDRYLNVRWTDEKQGLVYEARVDLHREFETGEHDLGDVVLSHLPLLVAGTVVDEQGMPVPDAQVYLRLAEITRSEDVVHHHSPQRTDGGQFTDADGAFRFHGEALEGEYDLEVRKGDAHADKHPVRAGQEGVRVVLNEGRMLAGRIRLPEELQSKRATLVFFQPTEQDPDALNWEMEVTDSYGFFRQAGLEAAPGRLAICLGTGYPNEHLLELEDVHPWLPGEAGDPRLLDIDLRDSFRSFHVRAVDAAGASITSAEFVQARKTSGGGTSWRTFDSLDGSYTFHGTEEAMKITIKASGYHPREVELNDPEMEIELEAAAEGSFLLSFIPEMPEHQTVVLDLEPIGFEIGGFSLDPDEFDATGRLKTFLPPPGRYTVSLSHRKRSPGSWSSSTHPVLDATGNPLEILIDEKGEAPTIQIALPSDFFDDWRGLE
ncbi:MAG: hypothetical protein ACPG31_02290 [Planctomycetota bacterium]